MNGVTDMGADLFEVPGPEREPLKAHIREFTEVAFRRGRTTRLPTYTAVAAGTCLDGPSSRALSYLLAEMADEDYAAGRGLWCAGVVRKDTHMPGQGFFRKAIRLGMLDRLTGTAARDQFWIDQLNLCYAEFGHGG